MRSSLHAQVLWKGLSIAVPWTGLSIGARAVERSRWEHVEFSWPSLDTSSACYVRVVSLLFRVLVGCSMPDSRRMSGGVYNYWHALQIRNFHKKITFRLNDVLQNNMLDKITLDLPGIGSFVIFMMKAILPVFIANSRWLKSHVVAESMAIIFHSSDIMTLRNHHSCLHYVYVVRIPSKIKCLHHDSTKHHIYNQASRVNVRMTSWVQPAVDPALRRQLV